MPTANVTTNFCPGAEPTNIARFVAPAWRAAFTRKRLRPRRGVRDERTRWGAEKISGAATTAARPRRITAARTVRKSGAGDMTSVDGGVEMEENTIITGDALAMLRTLPAQSVQCCVTSPPYWGLRDYGMQGQIGLEPTVEEHISTLTAIFRDVRRVLRDDGTLWVNYGDTYLCNQGSGFNGNKRLPVEDRRLSVTRPTWAKPKNLIGLPWRLAFALQADGWYLRSDIIWHKPNPMPESVKDRPTRAHEYIFLLSKSERYYYDHEAVREPAAPSFKGNAKTFRGGGAYTGGCCFENSAEKARESHGNQPASASRYSFRRENSKRAQGPVTHPQGTHRPDRDDNGGHTRIFRRSFCDISPGPDPSLRPGRMPGGRRGARPVFWGRDHRCGLCRRGAAVSRHRNQSRLCGHGRAAHRAGTSKAAAPAFSSGYGGGVMFNQPVIPPFVPRENVRPVVSVSGGKDSTATYLLAMEQTGGDFDAVFADTGNEHPYTYEYVARLHERTGGPKVQTVKADFSRELARKRAYLESGKAVSRSENPWTEERVREALAMGFEPTGVPFLDLCRSKGMFSTQMRAFCSQELKRFPLLELAHQPLIDAGYNVVSWQGIRAEESPRRACYPMWETSPESDAVTIYRPLMGWTVEDVAAMHKRHNVPLNPLYSMGFSRVGCMPCIQSNKQDIRLMAQKCPEAIAKIRQWERIVQAGSRLGLATFFHQDTTGSDVPVGIEDVVRWSMTRRGTRSGRQFDAMVYFEPPTSEVCIYAGGLCE